ncbi:BspA family leucine-rich repeat surface protein [Flavobacterium cerinum]|uniref:BspA family leucine-rich repeat surface protein n=1 Tax=Flavobacterium cerinum TaxID=2502784 RepID=A0ABY5IYZ0_9FLAO|nr:BspA family leucine-rich repeat surface protein [Flavobacterium cerinum]UUC46549.1 BspA family leucine-rich repeat surface protein [Flavobacterium cerinum]
MGTIADKLTYLGQTKAEIRDAIVKKGVAVTPETTFREYAGKILEINAEGNGNDPLDWIRPTDWLRIEDSVTTGDQKFVGLHAISEDSNFISFTATADYTVDWGDGVVENFTSGTQASHIYSYNSFPGTETATGYRQAIVTITPQNGQNLTSINLQKRHRQPLLTYYSTGWMDIRMSGPKMTSLVIGGSLMYHGLLEAFCFLGNNEITSFRRAFYACPVLESVILEDTSNAIDFGYMFASCKALAKIPLFNTSKGEDFGYMFQACTSLQKVPAFDTSNGNSFSSMFATCNALKTIPELNTANGRSFSGMFLECTALRTVPLLDTSKGTEFRSMFLGCTLLRNIPPLDTTSGIEFISMFSSCVVLRTIPVLNTAKGQEFRSMFHSCSALESVPVLKVTEGTFFNDMFANCGSLSKATFSGTKQSIAYDSCKLSRVALVDIFKNIAAGVVSKTINITNNWGAPSLTTEERAIATDKGWTIIG